MPVFIQVHEKGEKRLINLHWVEEVREEADGVCIYFAFSNPHAVEQDHMFVDESYKEIDIKIMEATL